MTSIKLSCNSTSVEALVNLTLYTSGFPCLSSIFPFHFHVIGNLWCCCLFSFLLFIAWWGREVCVLTHFSFNNSQWQFISKFGQVYILTVLKGLKHRLAAGITRYFWFLLLQFKIFTPSGFILLMWFNIVGVKLPNLSIILPSEETQIQTPSGEKSVKLAGRYLFLFCQFFHNVCQ